MEHFNIMFLFIACVHKKYDVMYLLLLMVGSQTRFFFQTEDISHKNTITKIV